MRVVSHNEQVQRWYFARGEALTSFRVEADKRTAAGEWLAGETAEKFVSEQLESWLKDNPYPMEDAA